MTLETQVLSWDRYTNMVELNWSTGSPTEIHTMYIYKMHKKICSFSSTQNYPLYTNKSISPMVPETLLICSLVAERRFYGLFFSIFCCDHRIRSQNTIRVTISQLMFLQSLKKISVSIITNVGSSYHTRGKVYSKQH